MALDFNMYNTSSENYKLYTIDGSYKVIKNDMTDQYNEDSYNQIYLTTTNQYLQSNDKHYSYDVVSNRHSFCYCKNNEGC